MVLQSNRRLRNARSNDGKAYSMGGVVYHGAGNKAGTGRNTGRPYNLHFLEACCKKLEPVVVPKNEEFVKKIREMLARVKEMRVRASAMGAGDDVMDVKQVEGILVNTEFVRPNIVANKPAETEQLGTKHAANAVGDIITLVGVAANTDANVVLAAAKAAMANVDPVPQQGNGTGVAGGPNAPEIVEVRGVVTTMMKILETADVKPSVKQQLKKEFDAEKAAVDAANNVA